MSDISELRVSLQALTPDDLIRHITDLRRARRQLAQGRTPKPSAAKSKPKAKKEPSPIDTLIAKLATLMPEERERVFEALGLPAEVRAIVEAGL